MVPLEDLMKKIVLPAPRRRTEVRAPPNPEPAEPRPLGREHVAAFQEQEIEKYKRASRMNAEPGDELDSRSHCDLSEVDTMTVGTMSLPAADPETSKIYEQYDFGVQNSASKKLEVYQSKGDILSKIEIHNVVIIKGATGCGKSTQVPQFILEDAREKNAYCNIVVTQPRRIAALSVAARVAEERRCGVGTLVGYQIGLDKNANDDTRILYVTTGVLLQRLIQQKQMKEFTHYIIDEIHERDQEMDFLLYMVRYFLNTNSKETRVILMSATIDTVKFYDYLFTYYGEELYKPGVVEVGYQTPYKVTTFYLDDLCRRENKIYEVAELNKSFDITTPEIQPNLYRVAARIILSLNATESEDTNQSSRKCGGGAVLVFLPGIHEIQTMDTVLKEMSSPQQLKALWIKPLHSSITAAEQQEVFCSPPSPSVRKVILSTNIAESSVTVSDIGYVIDFCLTKIQVTDPLTGCSSLELVWASRNHIVQRAGRVGRTREGRVYRLIPHDFGQNTLVQEAVPEILRCPLETLVLKAKLLGMDPPKKVLALTIDQPNLQNINQAVARLKQIGALLVCVGDEYDPSDGDLTWLGEIVANLPMDVRLGKLIFLACMLGIPEDGIIMACAMSNKSLFSTPYKRELESYNQKLFWSNSSCSDCLAFLNAYKAYRKCLYDGQSPKPWADSNYLQIQVLKEIGDLSEDIKRRLKFQNLYTFKRQKPQTMEEEGPEGSYHSFFLKMAIAGAFYPNYFIRGSRAHLDEKKIYTEMNGHDPFSTVYLQGLPSNELNKVYKGTIKKHFAKITDRLDVNVNNSSKAFVTFRRPLVEFEQGKIPGRINMSVYKAIKMRQMREEFSIPRLKQQEVAKILELYEMQQKRISDEQTLYDESNKDDAEKSFEFLISKLIWPWLKCDIMFANEILEVQVSHVESPGRFWIQSTLRNSVEMLRNMMSALNNDWNDGDMSLEKPSSNELLLDSIYVARYERAFRRCRILGKGLRRNTYAVYFIDFGYSANEVPVDEIREMSVVMKRELFYDKLPDFAMECALVKVQPKTEKLEVESVWHPKATNILKSFRDLKTIAKVYSIVNNVLRVKLVHPSYKDRKYHHENTVNFRLVRSGLAEKALEEFSSLFYRDELKRVYQVRAAAENNESGAKERRLREFLNKDDDDDDDNEEIEREARRRPEIASQPKSLTYDDVELPKCPANRSEIKLKGPFSSLEMKLTSMTKDAQGRTVDIERDSVNSVLLDSDPSDPKERMLVAAYIGMNPARDRFKLRHTTMMPNFPALPMLCCLTFSPMVEMRINAARTHYCGALCGLGYNRKTKESFYPADDIFVVFDYEIDHEVLTCINKLRLHLSRTMNANARERNSKDHFVDGSKYFREHLIKLFIERKYQLLETEYPSECYRWGMVRNDLLMDPVVPNENDRRDNRAAPAPIHPADDSELIYRPTWGVQLKGDREKEMKNLFFNLKKLDEYADNHSRNATECYLCKVQLENSLNAKLHLKTKIHRMRLTRYMELLKPEDRE